jgi:hypothetical protein
LNVASALHFTTMEKEHKKRLAVDIDMTLAQYEEGDIDKYGAGFIGAPIPEMVEKVKQELAKGTEVWIWTARVNSGDNSVERGVSVVKSYIAIANFCTKVFGQILPITHEKMSEFTDFWDDKARQVIPNTGLFLEELLQSDQEAQNAEISQ